MSIDGRSIARAIHDQEGPTIRHEPGNCRFCDERRKAARTTEHRSMGSEGHIDTDCDGECWGVGCEWCVLGPDEIDDD